MKIKHEYVLLIGLLVLFANTYDVAINLYLRIRYADKEIMKLNDNQLTFYTSKIEISDRFDANIAEERVEGTIRILINSKDFTCRCSNDIYPKFAWPERYGGIALITLHDTLSSDDKLFIVQVMDKLSEDESNFKDIRFRFLEITQDGRVFESMHSFREIEQSGYLTILARYVSPMSFREVKQPDGLRNPLKYIIIAILRIVVFIASVIVAIASIVSLSTKNPPASSTNA